MANLKDYATGTVLTAPAPATSGTSLTLQSGEGARMPAVPFYATGHPDNTLPTFSNAEKILVTAVSTDTLTIVRAQGGTSAKSIATGWRISNTIFASDLYNGSIVQNETPGGTINGSNTAFTIASAFTPGSLSVYLNGQRLKSGAGNDYTENSALTGFTMLYAPITGDVLLVDYTVGSSVIMQGVDYRINQETPTGSVNGSNTSFTTARGYISGSLEVFINGLLQAPTTHVTEVSPTAGTFTVDIAPATGDIVRVSYNYAVSTGGNAASVNGIAASITPTANQLLPLDSNASLATYQQAWQTPTLQNSWANYGAPFGNAAYMKDSLGFVHLAGLVKNGTAVGTTIFTLPAGYRPLRTRRWASDSNAAYGSVTVAADGTVVSAGSTIWIFLDPVIFKAEQ